MAMAITSPPTRRPMRSVTRNSAAPAMRSEKSSGSNLPGVKIRVAKPGLLQRAPPMPASKTDSDEAYLAGQAAVEAAIDGETDKMVTLMRGDGEHYTSETGLAPLSRHRELREEAAARMDQ